MRFSVADIKRKAGERLPVSWEEPADSFGDLSTWGIELQGSVKVNLIATHVGNRIIIEGQAHCPVQMECSRCLEHFTETLTIEIHEQYLLTRRPPTEENQEDQEIEEEDLPVLEGDGIDGTALVSAALFSQLPMKPLCQPECRGLCPDCGQNLNIAQCQCGGTRVDPRLAALEEWLKKNQGK